MICKNKAELKSLRIPVIRIVIFIIIGFMLSLVSILKPLSNILMKCVRLTKWHQYIFSVSLKFGARYITGQWGEFRVKSANICLHVLFW